MNKHLKAVFRKLTRASLTVEAALIAPLLLTAVFGILYLSFHLHNRTVLYESAAEQAISGHVQELPSYFALGDVERGGSESPSERTVSFRSGTVHFSGKTLYGISEEASFRIVRPVKTVRRFYAAREAFS